MALVTFPFKILEVVMASLAIVKLPVLLSVASPPRVVKVGTPEALS